MRTIKVDGVDCFVFLEALKLDKGMVINVLAPVNASVPKQKREYVSYRNVIVAGGEAVADAAKMAARDRAREIYQNLTADDVKESLTAAKKLVP